MLKDVLNVGFAGSIVKVSEGYARNFLIAKKLAVEVTPEKEGFYEEEKARATANAAALKSKIGMLAEKIKATSISLKKRAHDDGKLYGAISADDIVAALAAKEIAITKKQVIIDKKDLRTTGVHTVTINLGSNFTPALTVTIVAE